MGAHPGLAFLGGKHRTGERCCKISGKIVRLSSTVNLYGFLDSAIFSPFDKPCSVSLFPRTAGLVRQPR